MDNSRQPSALPSEAEQSSSPSAIEQATHRQPRVSLPETLSAYYDPEEVSSKFYLGDGSNRKMFAATSHGGLTGDRKFVKLRSGPSIDDPLLSDIVFANNAGFVTSYDREVLLGVEQPPVKFYRWQRTAKGQLSDRRYPYEYILFEGVANDVNGLDVDYDYDKPLALASWKRLGQQSEPFRIQFLTPEYAPDLGDNWRADVALFALNLWSRRMEDQSFSFTRKLRDVGRAVAARLHKS